MLGPLFDFGGSRDHGGVELSAICFLLAVVSQDRLLQLLWDDVLLPLDM